MLRTNFGYKSNPIQYVCNLKQSWGLTGYPRILFYPLIIREKTNYAFIFKEKKVR